jgi:hypothetical protein
VSWEPDYCTSEQLNHFVRSTDADIILDNQVEVALAITGASRAIDLACNRQFGQDETPTTRFYQSKVVSPLMRRVKIDDLMDTAGLTVVTNDDTASDVEYTLVPINAAAKNKPYTELRLTSHVPTVRFEDVRVTARFGWTAVPGAVQMACLLQASRFLSRREAPFGIAGSPEQGSEMRLLARVDPDVAVMLCKYIRWWA